MRSQLKAPIVQSLERFRPEERRQRQSSYRQFLALVVLVARAFGLPGRVLAPYSGYEATRGAKDASVRNGKTLLPTWNQEILVIVSPVAGEAGIVAERLLAARMTGCGA